MFCPKRMQLNDVTSLPIVDTHTHTNPHWSVCIFLRGRVVWQPISLKKSGQVITCPMKQTRMHSLKKEVWTLKLGTQRWDPFGTCLSIDPPSFSLYTNGRTWRHCFSIKSCKHQAICCNFGHNLLITSSKKRFQKPWSASTDPPAAAVPPPPPSWPENAAVAMRAPPGTAGVG